MSAGKYGIAGSAPRVCSSNISNSLTDPLRVPPLSDNILRLLPTALRDYEPRVHNYADQLLAKIAESEGKPIDATLWFNFFSFDVMGDLAWGKSFNMLRDGIKHYFMTALHADMVSVGLFSHLVWLFPAVKATPIVNHGFNKFWKWVHEQVKERRAVKCLSSPTWEPCQRLTDNVCR